MKRRSLAVREQEERREEERAESVFEAQMRKKDEELKEVKEELRNLSPSTPLWKIVTDKQYKDIFETHILKKLDELSFRVFREVNTESRDACRRSGRKLLRLLSLLLTVVIHQWQRKRPESSGEKKRSIFSAVKQLVWETSRWFVGYEK